MIRVFRWISVACLALAWGPAMAGGEDLRGETLGVANRALATLQKMASENLTNYGFKSMGEVSIAKLDEPLPVSMVRLDELRKYNSETKPSALLHRLNKVIYPVSVEGDTRSSVTIERFEGKWEASTYGDGRWVRSLGQLRKQLFSSSAASAQSAFLVEVPALDLNFLAFTSAEKLSMIPLFKRRALELAPGESYSAERVFSALVPLAQKIKGPDAPL